MSELYGRAYAALRECDPTAKCAVTQALRADWCAGRLAETPAEAAVQAVPEPGRPDRPALVAPQAVERRRVSTVAGRAALIHALTHIEFNAVNLALERSTVSATCRANTTPTG